MLLICLKSYLLLRFDRIGKLHESRARAPGLSRVAGYGNLEYVVVCFRRFAYASWFARCCCQIVAAKPHFALVVLSNSSSTVTATKPGWSWREQVGRRCYVTAARLTKVVQGSIVRYRNLL
jgi:hypothetical protein